MFHNKGAEYIHLLILMLSDIIIWIVLYYQMFKVNKIVNFFKFLAAFIWSEIQ